MSEKNLVFLIEGSEGWDTPIADLVAGCGDVGQKAVLIDLLKPESSALLGKAAGEGIAAFVSMEGVGARITANNRSIFEVLQAPLLTFLPDHPCFYAPLLTTPQKLVVPMFFSQDHVTAARGIFGNVPLAPVIEPWGPRTLELEGEPVPAIFVDASTFEVAKAFERQPVVLQKIVCEVREQFGIEHALEYQRLCESLLVKAIGDALACDAHGALSRVLERRWIPQAALSVSARIKLCQWAIATARVDNARRELATNVRLYAAGTGFPTELEPRLSALPPRSFPAFACAGAGSTSYDLADLLSGHRARLRVGASHQSGPIVTSATLVGSLLVAAGSSRFLDVAAAGLR